MARRTIIATSLALATMCSLAFAYSNVSPKSALQKVSSIQKSMRSFFPRSNSGRSSQAKIGLTVGRSRANEPRSVAQDQSDATRTPRPKYTA
jgi:hypothetical protein